MGNRIQQWPFAPDWADRLIALGFSRERERSRYKLNGVSFGMEGNWPVLKTPPASTEEDLPEDQMESRGFGDA